MNILNVNIEICGKMVHLGQIAWKNDSDACFSYSQEYLEASYAAPVSISLPLQKKEFTPVQTRNFFDGLLPEGFTRRSLMGSLHKSTDEYISLLHVLGRECIGALMICDDAEELSIGKAGYRKLTENQIAKLASEGASASTKILTKTHISLAGASGKVGLYLGKDGNWYLPLGIAPSTHIVKQSHVRLRKIVLNEQLCMKTAAACGIDTAENFIINIGGYNDADVLIASKRFDRKINPDAVGKLPVPARLHQEDFAQALGIPSEKKYEADGEHYMDRMFELIRNHSSSPIEDQRKLWQRIIYNILIGNTDGHLKNYSLLYSENLREIRLAPAYDILSTQIYKESTERMSFAINGKTKIKDVTRSDLISAGMQAGLGRKFAEERLDDLLNKFSVALKDTASELKEQGYTDAPVMAKSILKMTKIE